VGLFGKGDYHWAEYPSGNSGLILSLSNAKTLDGLSKILSKKENVKENPILKKLVYVTVCKY
jgi:hypothetical protein